MNRLPHKLMFQRGGQFNSLIVQKNLPTRSVVFVSKIIRLGPDLACKRIPSAKVIFYVPETLCA